MTTSGSVPPAPKPVMTVETFHEITGGAYRTLIDEEVRAIIATMTVIAEIACDCEVREHRPEGGQ